jgi:hypothetical protein
MYRAQVGRDHWRQPAHAAEQMPNHEDTHMDGALAVEDIGGHHGTVFSEGPRPKNEDRGALGNRSQIVTGSGVSLSFR